jgi:hypothetical protein
MEEVGVLICFGCASWEKRGNEIKSGWIVPITLMFAD